MRIPQLSLVTVLPVLAFLAGGVQAAEPVVAHTWDEAVAQSKAHGAPILIDFFTDW